jgi:hypothetical protein
MSIPLPDPQVQYASTEQSLQAIQRNFEQIAQQVPDGTFVAVRIV